MRKLFIFASLFLMVFATSCSDKPTKDQDKDNQDQNDGDDSTPTPAKDRLIKSISQTGNINTTTTFTYDDQERISKVVVEQESMGGAVGQAPSPLGRVSASEPENFVYTYEYTYADDQIVMNYASGDLSYDVEFNLNDKGYVVAYSYDYDMALSIDDMGNVNEICNFNYDAEGYLISTNMDHAVDSQTGENISVESYNSECTWSEGNKTGSKFYLVADIEEEIFSSDFKYSDYENDIYGFDLNQYITTNINYQSIEILKGVLGVESKNLVSEIVSTGYKSNRSYITYKFDGETLTGYSLDSYQGEPGDSVEDMVLVSEYDCSIVYYE